MSRARPRALHGRLTSRFNLARLNFARLNFARLNHILIPSTKEGRDRFRRSWLGRAARPLVQVYEGLSSEGQVFAVAAILAGAFGLDVQTTQAHELWGALGALLAASFACSRGYPLRGFRIDVAAPPRVSVGDEIVFAIRLANDSPREQQAIRFAGPFLPWDGLWSAASPALTALASGTSARVEMRARFGERGEHHLDPFRAAALVPFGLALGPAVYSRGCRFLVVPRIARVVSLSLPLAQRHQPGGVALASKTGDSLELLGVRAYRPGDPLRDLHARSWAKRGAPVVREFQQEYFTRIGVALDTDLASGPPQQLEAAISLAAGIAAHLGSGEALIDLRVVAEPPHALTVGRSVGSLEQALDLLACVRVGAAFRADSLLEALRPCLPRLSCLVFIALRWDAERARAAQQVRACGVGARCIVVGDPAEAGEGAQWVAPAAIAAGEALAL